VLQVFDFGAIRNLFARKDFSFCYDSMHGVQGPCAQREPNLRSPDPARPACRPGDWQFASGLQAQRRAEHLPHMDLAARYARKILVEELGGKTSSCINSVPKEDFGGPSPEPNLSPILLLSPLLLLLLVLLL
jgi:phosphoglucomutase